MKSKNAKNKLLNWMESIGIEKHSDKLKLVDDFFTDHCTKKIPSTWSTDRIQNWKWTYTLNKIKYFYHYVGAYLQMKNMGKENIISKQL